MKKLCLIVFLASCFVTSAQVVRIWQDVETVNCRKSRLLLYPAPDSNNTGAAVIICPGGSYHHLGIPHEGRRTAEWFNSIGVNAFVLCYRVSSWGWHHPAMIEDFQRAMQYVREHASVYGIDTGRVGAIGFSAGGHLVAMAGAVGMKNYLKPLGVTTSVGLRPNWVAPVYPVISMQDSIAHVRSRKNLLTRHYTVAQRDSMSLELTVPKDMPPVFLQASKDDDVVDVRNSIAYHKALEAKGIPHAFYLYDTGGHGYGMKDCEFLRSSHWQDKLHDWLKTQKIIKY